ncbi:MAG: phosphatidate cytidylyltransferase [Xanthobacteraceae bacterium]
MIEADQRDNRRRNFALRVASAAVLAPAVLVLTYVGGWPFLALCFLGALGILYEWTLLVARSPAPGILIPGTIALVAAAFLTGLAMPNAALIAIAIGVAAAALFFAKASDGASVFRAVSWAAGGVVYAGAALLGPALLRRDPDWGLTALLLLFATVWATDIFAFFCGRLLGGPLLWPRVSPKKTWSGAMGGLAGGVAGGLGVAYTVGIGKLGMIGAMALLLSVLAQAGDLLESAIKRRFGAKDSGAFIPGHGGLMDRLDGFLVAALSALIIGALRHGTDAPATGLLVW